MKLVMIAGVQAAGKTTFSKKFISENPDFIYVNSDLWWETKPCGKRVWYDDDGKERCWHTEPIPPHILEEAYSWAYNNFRNLLFKRRNILYEATFSTPERRKPIVEEAKSHIYAVEGIFIYPSLLTCVLRNRDREHPVPDKVLARTYSKLELPTYDEGFDKLTIIGDE